MSCYSEAAANIKGTTSKLELKKQAKWTILDYHVFPTPCSSPLSPQGKKGNNNSEDTQKDNTPQSHRKQP